MGSNADHYNGSLTANREKRERRISRLLLTVRWVVFRICRSLDFFFTTNEFICS
jgi:hypothetical protein